MSPLKARGWFEIRAGKKDPIWGGALVQEKNAPGADFFPPLMGGAACHAWGPLSRGIDRAIL
jgi:hypothetical protein